MYTTMAFVLFVISLLSIQILIFNIVGSALAFNDVYELDMANPDDIRWSKLDVANPPPPRYRHTAIAVRFVPFPSSYFYLFPLSFWLYLNSSPQSYLSPSSKLKPPLNAELLFVECIIIIQGEIFSQIVVSTSIIICMEDSDGNTYAMFCWSML